MSTDYLNHGFIGIFIYQCNLHKVTLRKQILILHVDHCLKKYRSIKVSIPSLTSWHCFQLVTRTQVLPDQFLDLALRKAIVIKDSNRKSLFEFNCIGSG